MKILKTLTAGALALGMAVSLAAPASAAGTLYAQERCNNTNYQKTMKSGGNEASTTRSNAWPCGGDLGVRAYFKRGGTGNSEWTEYKYAPNNAVRAPGFVTKGEHRIRDTSGNVLRQFTT